MIGITGLGETSAVHKVVASGLYDSVQTYVNAVNPSGWLGDGGGRPGPELRPPAGHRARARRRRGWDSGAGGGRPGADPDPRASRRTPATLAAALTQGGTYNADLDRAARLQALAAELGLEGAGRDELPSGDRPPGPLDGSGRRLRASRTSRTRCAGSSAARWTSPPSSGSSLPRRSGTPWLVILSQRAPAQRKRRISQTAVAGCGDPSQAQDDKGCCRATDTSSRSGASSSSFSDWR